MDHTASAGPGGGPSFFARLLLAGATPIGENKCPEITRSRVYSRASSGGPARRAPRRSRSPPWVRNPDGDGRPTFAEFFMVLASIVRWIAKRKQRPVARRAGTARPRLERLERRDVPSTLGARVVGYAQAHVKLKVGGGECAH